jgi:hypothetical protein
MERTSIKATEGHILTNGEIYGSEIFLADGLRSKDFYEITKVEYDAILAEQEKERQGDGRM